MYMFSASVMLKLLKKSDLYAIPLIVINEPFLFVTLLCSTSEQT